MCLLSFYFSELKDNKTTAKGLNTVLWRLSFHPFQNSHRFFFLNIRRYPDLPHSGTMTGKFEPLIWTSLEFICYIAVHRGILHSVYRFQWSVKQDVSRKPHLRNFFIHLVKLFEHIRFHNLFLSFLCSQNLITLQILTSYWTIYENSEK